MPEELKPFVEITVKEWEKLKAQKLTWEDIRKRYYAPKWCSEGQYGLDALGCWSLIAIGADYRITKEEDCLNCDLYRGNTRYGKDIDN